MTASAQSGAELLRAAALRLTDAGVEGAERDAQILFLHALGLPRHRLNEALTTPPEPEAAARFEAAIAARTARQPVSQITGRRAFWMHDFEVTRDTLDPRAETELLVETGLEAPFLRVLDMGTGTGAILLSLLAERPGATGIGSDISDAALAVARRNAARIGTAVAGRAEFILSDWYEAIPGQFDLIVSNPPYIALAEMPGLSPEVRDWEPWGALTDHGDGLTAYRRIAEGAAARLAPGGRIAVEIGYEQGPAVAALFAEAGFGHVEIRQDLGQRDRVILAHI
ncbi:peptide chain release factor N(5)-glutamine methyltransferase [Paracoccus aminophilus]|uniref:Release factor glutamine methyltransferase n=1 Tax=Paracoccus aminophilus JCM 7686 TaxID=1367847 RepID=S5XRU7_PARAH|nr:peptide chain release factor N(5)-glutamine methyltransferase [Paracoccus aminophilus]AGT07837.1 methylase of polypeptide chain release factors [Paracoccus aminophilus JCM 7686]